MLLNAILMNGKLIFLIQFINDRGSEKKTIHNYIKHITAKLTPVYPVTDQFYPATFKG